MVSNRLDQWLTCCPKSYRRFEKIARGIQAHLALVGVGCETASRIGPRMESHNPAKLAHRFLRTLYFEGWLFAPYFVTFTNFRAATATGRFKIHESKPMRVLVILNPFANHQQALEKTALVKSVLSEAGLSYNVVTTKSKGDASWLAASAGGYDAVVAAGGDGTVNEVVNGLLSASGDRPSQPLGIIPLGTGT